MPKKRRVAQIRGGALVLFRNDSLELSNLERALILLDNLSVTPQGSRALRIGKRDTLWFDSSSVRDVWLQMLRNSQFKEAEKLSQYDIVRQVGRGANGTVFLVTEKSTGTPYAMKVIRKQDVFYTDASLRYTVSERVALEEAALRDSAFIIRLLDAFQTDEHLYLVAEVAAFGDLHNVRVQMENERFSEPVASMLFAEIVSGLDEVHRLGYLYRDLKLENILLSADGHVRLADFGLARRMDVSETSSVSGDDSESDDGQHRLVGHTTSFVGTRRYMSPEHLNVSGAHVVGYGSSVDVWALGVSLYVLLTGSFPYAKNIRASDTGKLFWAIKNEEIEFPSYLSKDAVSLLKGLLERNVGERLNIREIKQHPWLNSNGIDFARLHMDSRNNTPSPLVLNALASAGIKRLDSVHPLGSTFSPTELERLPVEMHVGSYGSDAASRSKPQKRPQAKRTLSEHHLIGFGHISSLDNRLSLSDVASDVTL